MTMNAQQQDLVPYAPPPEAIAEIRRQITEHVAGSIPPKVTAKRTDVDAHLLEGWRSAAKDPESEIFDWLTVGGANGYSSYAEECRHLPRSGRHA